MELSWQITVALILISHLSMGLGFAIASWLQAAELEVNEGKEVSSFFTGPCILFIVFWWLFVIHCYRHDVKKVGLSIKQIVELAEKKKAAKKDKDD